MTQGVLGDKTRSTSLSQLRHMGLSERQLTLIQLILTGVSKLDAGKLAGYGSDGATANALAAPKVRAAMALACEQALATDLAPTAIGIAHRMLLDKDTPASVRATLALGVMDRAGFNAKRFERNADQNKEPSQMTADELQAAIDKLQGEIDGRMVDVTPHDTPSAHDPFDFIE